MKRLLLLIAVSIVWSGSVLQAQEYEYVPLVREGIEWGYKNGEIYSCKDRAMVAITSIYHNA